MNTIAPKDVLITVIYGIESAPTLAFFNLLPDFQKGQGLGREAQLLTWRH